MCVGVGVAIEMIPFSLPVGICILGAGAVLTTDVYVFAVNKLIVNKQNEKIKQDRAERKGKIYNVVAGLACTGLAFKIISGGFSSFASSAGAIIVMGGGGGYFLWNNILDNLTEKNVKAIPEPTKNTESSTESKINEIAVKVELLDKSIKENKESLEISNQNLEDFVYKCDRFELPKKYNHTEVLDEILDQLEKM